MRSPARVAAAPPAPQPVPPPAEEKPISIVQNAVALPPEQPVPPEAWPPLDPPEQTAPRSQPSDAEAARKRTAARKPAEAPPAAAPGSPSAAPSVTASAPSTGTLVGSDPNLPGRAAVAARINDVKASAARIPQPSLTLSQRTTLRHVESFLKLSEKALSRGDLRQAGELADRAATLTRALTRE